MRSMPLLGAGEGWAQPATTAARTTQKRGRSRVWVRARIVGLLSKGGLEVAAARKSYRALPLRA